MKRTFILLCRVSLALLMMISTKLSFSQCNCDFTISLNGTQWFFDGNANGVQPGDTICLTSGTRSAIELRNIHGAPGNPVVITNMCNGKFIINDIPQRGNAMPVRNCSYIRITGSNNPNEEYGIEFTGTHNGLSLIDKTTDVEVDHVYIHNVGGVGLQAKTDPTCDSSTWRGNFEMNNVYLHHNLLDSIGGEGFYVGNSHYVNGVTKNCNGNSITVYEHDMHNVDISYNTVKNIRLDGIQVSAVLDSLSIHHNYVYNFGYDNVGGHQQGIQVGAGCHGIMYNNIIEKGTGYCFYDGTRGNSQYYNNICKEGKAGGFIVTVNPPYISGPNIYANNLILNPRGRGFHLYSSNNPHIIVNNLMVNDTTGVPWISPVFGSVQYSDINNIKTTNINSIGFVNAAAGDYHLQQSSPAIDSGINVIDSFGMGLNFDLDDNPRGPVWDIGPYEYQDTANIEPIANAGADQTLTLPDTVITLTGTASDPDGFIATISWTQVSGAPATLTNDTSLSVTISGLAPGIYEFVLSVTDNLGAVGYDSVMVTVNYAGIARFNFALDNDTIPGWTTVYGYPHEGFIEQRDALSNIRVNNVSASQWNPLDLGTRLTSAYAGGMTNGTVQPAEVVLTNWFNFNAPYGSTVDSVLQGDNIQLLDLKPNQLYQLNIGASRRPGGTADQYGLFEYRFNGVNPQNFLVTNNTSSEVVVTALSDSIGRIGISARKISGSSMNFGYIGWLVVTESDSSSSARQVVQTMSTDRESSIRPLLIYPNPASHSLYIDLTAFEGMVELRVSNIMGQVLQQKKVQGGSVQQLQVGELPEGIYSVTIQPGNKKGTITKKIVIRK